MIRRPPLPFLAVKTGADKTYAVRRHFHDTLSIGFVEKGSSIIRCHPLEFSLGEGDVILIPPLTIHLCQPRDPMRFRFRMIYVCPKWLEKSLGTDSARLAPQTASLSRADRKDAAAFFTAVQDKADRLLDETHAIFFLDHILNTVFCRDDAPTGHDAKKAILPAPGRMDKVKRFLDDHFDRDIQLDDLADIAGTSKYAVLRQFKHQWQITPHAYVINRRILAAKTQLKAGHSVADTAAACGFFDQSHFIKTFKNFTGIRPADFAG